MKTYNVTIKATIVQTIQVDAENETAAAELAHQLFDVDEMENEVSYDEEMINMEEVK